MITKEMLGKFIQDIYDKGSIPNKIGILVPKWVKDLALKGVSGFAKAEKISEKECPELTELKHFDNLEDLDEQFFWEIYGD